MDKGFLNVCQCGGPVLRTAGERANEPFVHFSLLLTVDGALLLFPQCDFRPWTVTNTPLPKMLFVRIFY